MKSPEQRSVDPASVEMMNHMADQDISTAWDRYDAMQPQCGFGQLGLCCRNCSMGPCRIDPVGDGPTEGICGATADVIAARNLGRMIAAGSASHSDHGRDIAHSVLAMSEGKADDFQIRDERKLRALAEELGVETDGKEPMQIAHDVAVIFLAQFSQQEGETVLTARAPAGTREAWRKAGVVPRGMDREVVEMMHRTHIGVDNEPTNTLLHGMRTALADGWGGSMIATDLTDVLFHSPMWTRAKANLGILDEKSVNIIVHGHEPSLSEMIVAVTQEPEMLELAKRVGAEGITLGGMCCTANEILVRHGISVAGNFLQQELAIGTGAIEAMVVDVQCVFPSLGKLSQCFHTKLISTSPKAKFPFAQHVEFEESRAMEVARQIVRMAIENFPNRDKQRVMIPTAAEMSSPMVAGFSAENTFQMLGGRYRPSYRR